MHLSGTYKRRIFRKHYFKGGNLRNPNHIQSEDLFFLENTASQGQILTRLGLLYSD